MLTNDVFPALELRVTQAAKQLDVSSMALSRVLNGRAAYLARNGVTHVQLA
jgi:hypothetical protein